MPVADSYSFTEMSVWKYLFQRGKRLNRTRFKAYVFINYINKTSWNVSLAKVFVNNMVELH